MVKCIGSSSALQEIDMLGVINPGLLAQSGNQREFFGAESAHSSSNHMSTYPQKPSKKLRADYLPPQIAKEYL